MKTAFRWTGEERGSELATVADYLEMFSPNQQTKPRFMALAEVILRQALEMIWIFQEGIAEGWGQETAVGRQLDGIGELVGVSRPTGSTEDADYRKLIRARIAAHHWDGTNGTLPEALRRAFPGMGAKMVDQMNGTVGVQVNGTLPFSFEEMFPAPAGIRVMENEGQG